jgi:hypothetical protein
MVDIETVFTDYEWNKNSRPILIVRQDRTAAALFVSGPDSLHKLPNVDLEEKTSRDLLSLLEGYRDIFASAAEWLKKQANGPECNQQQCRGAVPPEH